MTFLFTDIEGSTDLVQQYPDESQALLACHHDLLHQAMETHQGYVFQIVGDAFSVAFPTMLDALKAAIEAQHLLYQEAWSPARIKVRMSIHTGAAQAGNPNDRNDRSDGYTGYETLARAQRVMSAAHGGQVLLSNVSAALVRSQLPAGVTLRDMGEHRLKGFLHPEQLWQVVIPDLPQIFSQLHTLSVMPNSPPPLPEPLTRFIGRTAELRELEHLLPTTRLLCTGYFHNPNPLEGV